MSNNTKRCPKCGGHVIDSRHTFEHQALHVSAHQVRHHPVIAACGFAAVAISKLLPKTYHCPGCRHTFRA